MRPRVGIGRAWVGIDDEKQLPGKIVQHDQLLG
jgi:hypothetical protein